MVFRAGMHCVSFGQYFYFISELKKFSNEINNFSALRNHHRKLAARSGQRPHGVQPGHHPAVPQVAQLFPDLRHVLHATKSGQ